MRNKLILTKSCIFFNTKSKNRAALTPFSLFLRIFRNFVFHRIQLPKQEMPLDHPYFQMILRHVRF